LLNLSVKVRGRGIYARFANLDLNGGAALLEELYLEVEMRMEAALEATVREMTHIRTGRANPAILDKLAVEAYEQQMPLKQLATVATPDAHTILIKPFDRNILANIERAISKSDIGLTPINDGHTIRLSFPPLTAERRMELVKAIKKLAEEGRISVRNTRREANDQVKKMEKGKEIAEDESHKALDEIQELTDKYIEEIDEAFKKKEAEITQMR
jgi:ribosome recycling factor